MNYAEYMHFFKMLGNAQPKLKSIIAGDWKKVLNQQRSEINYPAYWIETPDVSYQWNGGMLITFTGSFTVMYNAPIDDDLRIEFNKNRAFVIADQIIKALFSATQQEEICFNINNNNISLDPVDTITHDNDHGWRANYSIQLAVDDCLCDCTKNRTCPVGAIPAFSWENNNEGDFTDLTITNKSAPDDHEWHYEWMYIVDNGPQVSVTADTLDINTLGNHLYIQLTITDANGCHLCASAAITSCQGCGESVPYIYKSKNI